ncbi:universal stress protein [Pandoraea commovens]|uniref:Universal stress protein n=1 Tax=Pandoraea commovens TaxID=2508289 RepID=A0A5E4S5Y4_9BURK|nr:universal stress protein [Pandoraea commovens]UVA77429.1 universal stress protein [Pandoraea commovens]VVD69954.1 universal stress protein [Pandoraea commovens]
MTKRILLATDGSESSRRALREAAAFARHGDAIRVIHTVEDPVNLLTAAFGKLIDLEQVRRDMQREGEEHLARAVLYLREEGFDAQAHLLDLRTTGETVPEAMTREAIEWGADIIVVGTHGRSGVRRAMLGSVAEQILRSAEVPVMLVAGEARPHQPLRAGGHYERILVALDDSETSRLAFEYALALARTHGASMRVVHVLDLPGPFLAGFDPEPLLDAVRAVAEQVRSWAQKRLKEAEVPGEIEMREIQPVGEGVADQIIAAGRDADVDLIVLGTHGRRGFRRFTLGSVAEDTARHAGRPVLLLPAHAPSTK